MQILQATLLWCVAELATRWRTARIRVAADCALIHAAAYALAKPVISTLCSWHGIGGGIVYPIVLSSVTIF